MHWLIVGIGSFSGRNSGVNERKTVSFEDLPKVVQLFIKVFNYPFIVLDESSRIKTNVPMPEHKKSIRCRTVKLLNQYGERSIASGTMKSKSPLNIWDQAAFLDPTLFPESMYEFAERYCIMITIRVGRGKRVCISSKVYKQLRDRMSRAWMRGGEQALSFSKSAIAREYVITDEALEWIIAHSLFSPFLHQDELVRRMSKFTMFVQRSDVFDISFEKFVHDPIMRYVELSKEAKQIGNELVNLGFTDNLVLGRAPALELATRLQDVCNGFEPIEHKVIGKDGKEHREITYRELSSNPKLDELSSLMDEIGVEDNQIIIVATRLNILDAVEAMLIKDEISYVRYKDENKKEAEDAFMNGKAQIFLSITKTCAYGLNSMGNCDYIISVCADSHTEDFHQLQHRILRGQLTHQKFMYMITAKNSVDEKIAVSLSTGNELISDRNTKSIFEFA